MYIYTFSTVEYNSAIMKNEMSFAGKWMELGVIMVSEINQNEQDRSHMFSFIGRIWPKKKKRLRTVQCGYCLGLGTSGGGRRSIKERMRWGESDWNTLCTCMKIEWWNLLKLFLKMGRRLKNE
jgi:hypothetical protein